MIQLKNIIPTDETPKAVIYVVTRWKPGILPLDALTEEYVSSMVDKNDDELIRIHNFSHFSAVYICPSEPDSGRRIEKCRRAGDKIQVKVNELKIDTLSLESPEGLSDEILAITEGIMLGSYQFFPFKTDKNKKLHSLKTIFIGDPSATHEDLVRLSNTVGAVSLCRDLVNLPANHLNTLQLADKLTVMAQANGITIEVLNKKQIESLKMGGLLGVNRGSVDPPVFIIMEYKPENAVNTKPLVFTGKGITFDTGGLNLKTGNFMDNMKLDMGGAAAVATALQAIAANHVPVHTLALIPATDNRPDGNAMTSGDVITMYDGTTVEVLNTDAEGRLILADALAWACRYEPMLVVNVATLTGAAARAIGIHGVVGMHQKAEPFMHALKTAGELTGERIAELPFWEEYGEEIKSEIADLKNIGGPEGGAIIAGKFLAHFTRYPFIHLDIAGPVFIEKRDNYRGPGATGVGTRLLEKLASLIAATSR